MLKNVVFPGNRAICKCPPGYTGDPFVRCNADPCSQSPCGINADCESAGNRAVCKCRQGYEVRRRSSTDLLSARPSTARPSPLTGNYSLLSLRLSRTNNKYLIESNLKSLQKHWNQSRDCYKRGEF